MTLQPIQLLIVILAGWINREQHDVIDYLRTENRVPKEGYGKKLGRKRLGDIATIVTPDTILGWHRDLIRRKWDFSDRRTRVGRKHSDKPCCL